MPDEFKFRALTGEDYKDGLTFKEGEKDCSYTSPFLNSGIPECQWHRIRLKADIPENATITVSFSTSEYSDRDETGKWSKGLVFKENARDAIIQAPSGQYIRLKIDLHCEGEKPPVLEQVRVYYPRLSYLRYLPEVYQEDSESSEFLERFLSIFESVLYDSEETISRIPLYFDPMAAPEEFYRWLADCVSLDLYELLTDDEKREFILRAVEFYKQKGTLSGLSTLVSFLTKGKKCCIKEYKNNMFCSYQMKHDSVFEVEPDDLECKGNPGIRDECTRFYRSTSRTFVKNMMPNKGEYCDGIHYVTGMSKEGTKEEIGYFSNSIGIFVFFPSDEELLINEYELRKIIDSFLPVFVRARIKFVPPPLTESYPLSWIEEHFSDVLTDRLEEEIGIVTGDYIDEIPGWKRFYTYYDYKAEDQRKQKIPDYGYGITYTHENKAYRTVHEGIGYTHAI
jgi:phage tail-like protein